MLMSLGVHNLKLGKRLFLKMVPYTKDSGVAITNMGMEFRNGLMERGMKECGQIVRHVERESFGMLMEIFLKESGMMIRQMGLEFTNIQTEQVTQATGKMTYSMAKARSFGPTGVSISETIKWGEKMARVNTGGQTEALIMDRGWTIK
jgi:hypothetical protein